MSSAAPGPDGTIHSRLREGFHSPGWASTCAGAIAAAPNRIAGIHPDMRPITACIAVLIPFLMAVCMFPPGIF
jgi:hypothetical protein